MKILQFIFSGLIACGLAHSALAQSVYLPSPVVWWRFDESAGSFAGDSTGGWSVGDTFRTPGVHPGTIVGAPTWTAAGKVRGALSFDGSATEVLSTGYVGATKTMSCVFWIHPTTLQDSVVVDKLDFGGTGKGWAITLTSSGAVRLLVGSATNHQILEVQNAYTPGQWAHVAVSWEGPTKKTAVRSRALLAVNGLVESALCGMPFSPRAQDVPLRLGASPALVAALETSAPGHYLGLLDDFRLMNQALNRETIAQLPPNAPPTAIRWSSNQFYGGITYESWSAWLIADDVDPEDYHDFQLVAGDGDADNALFTVSYGVLRYIGPASRLTVAGQLSLRLYVVDSRGATAVFPIVIPIVPYVDPGTGGGGGGVVIVPPTPGPVNVQWNFTQCYGGVSVATGEMLGYLDVRDVGSNYYFPRTARLALVAGEGDADNSLVRLELMSGYYYSVRYRVYAQQAFTFDPSRSLQLRLRGSVLEASGTTDNALVIATPRIWINEFVANNEFGLTDLDGETPDWIEIRNGGNHTLILEDWCLSNDPAQPALWRVPTWNSDYAWQIGPGQSAVFYASGKGLSSPTSASLYHTNFTLQQEGCEYLSLHAPDGLTKFHEFRLLPEIDVDDSYGYPNDNPALPPVIFKDPTPGYGNYAAPSPTLPPVASIPSSVSEDTLSVVLTPVQPSDDVIYTTDGSAPSFELDGSPKPPALRATGLIQITTATVLRARSRAPSSGAISKEIIRTYIITPGVAAAAEMDPTFPGSSAAQVEDALAALPALSIVPDDPVRFATLTAPYPGGGMHEASMEMIFPAGTSENNFQSRVAVRVAGQSRIGRTDKTAFRFSFDKDDGVNIPNGLTAPFFGPGSPSEFREIAVRAAFQNSWTHPDALQQAMAQETRDQFARESHRAMGHSAAMGRFVHLFIGGKYMGIYNPTEVPDAASQAGHLGCERQDYDTIDGGEVQDGGQFSYEAWQDLVALLDSPTPNWPAIKQRMDVISFIDFVVLNTYLGNNGMRLWADPHFVDDPGTEKFHNFYAGRNWFLEKPFQFFMWDAEDIMGAPNANWLGALGGVSGRSGCRAFINLLSVPEFKQMAMDSVWKHITQPLGALNSTVAAARYTQIANQVDAAIHAESARWGRFRKPAQPWQRTDWLAEKNRLLTGWFPARGPAVTGQFAALGLGNLSGSALSQPGGNVAVGTSITISPPPSDGTVAWFTFSIQPQDPRAPDGSIGSAAAPWPGSYTPATNGTLSLRWRYANGAWGPLTRETYLVGPQAPKAGEIEFSEIMFASAQGDSGDFVEIHNLTANTLNLGGMTFTTGFGYTFPAGQLLPPGGYLCVAYQDVLFRLHVSATAPMVGPFYSGKLSDSGESITLSGAGGFSLRARFGTSGSWPQTAEASGARRSLVPLIGGITDPYAQGHWRASTLSTGSPGTADPEPFPNIVISEIYAGSGTTSFVELYNQGTAAVSLNGWELVFIGTASNSTVPLPSGLIISGGSYLAITGAVPADLQTAFLNAPGSVLVPPVAGTHQVDSATTPSLVPSYSLIRYIKSGSSIPDFVHARPTRGLANGLAQLPDLVINEIMYHPPLGTNPTQPEVEFIEFLNRSNQPLVLRQENLEIPHLGWLEVLPAEGVTVPAGGMFVLTNVAPAQFRSIHRVPAEVPVLQFFFVLSNNGEALVIQRRLSGNISGYLPDLTDLVNYSDTAPWPERADGAGRSLERLNPAGYGNDPANWSSSCLYGGSPGRLRGAPFTDWRNQHFSPAQMALPAISAPASDPDGDGLNNLLEYALGANPLNPSAGQLPVPADAPFGCVGISYNRRPSAETDVSYHIEHSLDLANWTEVTAQVTTEATVPHTDGTETVTQSYAPPVHAGSCGFLRLRVVR
jgi:hypothetical protein